MAEPLAPAQSPYDFVSLGRWLCQSMSRAYQSHAWQSHFLDLSNLRLLSDDVMTLVRNVQAPLSGKVADLYLRAILSVASHLGSSTVLAVIETKNTTKYWKIDPLSTVYRNYDHLIYSLLPPSFLGSNSIHPCK